MITTKRILVSTKRLFLNRMSQCTFPKVHTRTTRMTLFRTLTGLYTQLQAIFQEEMGIYLPQSLVHLEKLIQSLMMRSN